MPDDTHLHATPLTLRQANALVLSWHRHHKPDRGHRFSIGVMKAGILVGAAIIGRPKSKEIDAYQVAEVSRLVTDGTAHACSFLYAASARACLAMGYLWIQTYILDDEPGTSVEAAGWTYSHTTKGGSWESSARYKAQGRRHDQPETPKKCYMKSLNGSVPNDVPT